MLSVGGWKYCESGVKCYLSFNGQPLLSCVMHAGGVAMAHCACSKDGTLHLCAYRRHLFSSVGHLERRRGGEFGRGVCVFVCMYWGECVWEEWGCI